MNYIEFFGQLFLIAFGVFAALVLAFRLIWPKVENHYLQLHSIRQNRLVSKETLQMRYAAYERLLLFIHRITPKQIMLRSHDPRITVRDFKQNLVAEIENEFQHNFTQQLYVSDAAWVVIKDLKENTLALFRNSANGLPEEATVDHYVAMVFKHINDLDVNPYDAAQIVLKKEMTF